MMKSRASSSIGLSGIIVGSCHGVGFNVPSLASVIGGSSITSITEGGSRDGAGFKVFGAGALVRALRSVRASFGISALHEPAEMLYIEEPIEIEPPLWFAVGCSEEFG